jgi:hypothetical protein
MTPMRVVLLAIVMTPAIAQAQGAIAVVPNERNTWFQQPCQGDSVDTWGWTRYDLHGLRIRVPREARSVPVPGGDELKFRKGRATLRLRLHRDAREMFRQVNQPTNVHRHCLDEVGGILAEVISFGSPLNPGYAANWADADRGEYLTAIVYGSSADDVTFLRRALFTIQFPGERRR